MTSQSDSPNRIFQVYISRKRKFLDSVQHSESESAVSHGSVLVAGAKDSHLGEESCLKRPAGLSYILNNSQGFALQDVPSRATKLSGIRCTTSPCQPNETMLCTISTDNATSKCQDPSQLLSPLMLECTNHTIPSKPRHPHISFELMHRKTVSDNSCAKDKDSTDQSQTAVVQNLLLSCEKGERSIVAMDHPSLSYPDKIQLKEGVPSYEAVKHDVQDSTKAVDISNTLSPHSLDDETKSVVGQLSPSVYECLWDVTIQLSSTSKVSVIAFFKSGEKVQDITWPKIIEIKGKVKLDAFEKFVYELRRCQTRSLMVISLCWKVGTSKAGLKGMKEVAENFEVNQKVGFADICDGYSLYVCPRSDAIITILAKCGFFKGMSAVDTNQDSLMGCIVWRRKESPCAPRVGARPPTSLPYSEGYQATPCSNYPRVDSRRSKSKIQNDIEKTQEIRSTSVKTHVVAIGLPSHCGHDESIGFELASAQEYASNAAKSSKQQENHPFFRHPNSYGAHRPNDTDDLPEFDFTTLCRAEVKCNVHPLRPKLSGNKSSKPFQQPLQPLFQVASIKNHENVEVKGNVTDMMSRERPNQVYHCKTKRQSFRNKDGIDAEDMLEWHFQGLDKPHQSSSTTKLPSPSSKTFTMAEASLQAFPPINERSHSPLEIEGSSSSHHPNMQAGCLNILRDQGSFPWHRPPVIADKCIAARHPPVLVDQGSVPRHPPPLADQGLFPWHPPPLADQDLFPWRPPPLLADQDLFPQHPPPLPARQCIVPWHPRPIFVPGHMRPNASLGQIRPTTSSGPMKQTTSSGHMRPTASSGLMRPSSGSAPLGTWRPVLHPGQVHHHYGPE